MATPHHTTPHYHTTTHKEDHLGELQEVVVDVDVAWE